MNPYSLIEVFDASKIPPVNAQELLESFSARLENLVRSGYHLMEFFNFEKCNRCIFATFPNSFSLAAILLMLEESIVERRVSNLQ